MAIETANGEQQTNRSGPPPSAEEVSAASRGIDSRDVARNDPMLDAETPSRAVESGHPDARGDHRRLPEKSTAGDSDLAVVVGLSAVIFPVVYFVADLVEVAGQFLDRPPGRQRRFCRGPRAPRGRNLHERRWFGDGPRGDRDICSAAT
jgi:hypothetical protein